MLSLDFTAQFKCQSPDVIRAFSVTELSIANGE
jgi:hypothetical protein